MSVIIAEELLLLAYREDTGKPLVGSAELNAALGGALLAELAVNHRVDLTGKKVVATDPAPLGDDELDAALARVSGEAKERAPDWWVGRLGTGKLRERLLTRLAERGVLSAQESKVLGLFPTTRYPERDPSIERALRQRVESVLAGAEPDQRVAVLLALLHACKLDKKTFPDADPARIKEIIEGSWAGDAVKKTIDAIYAVVITTVVISAAASS